MLKDSKRSCYIFCILRNENMDECINYKMFRICFCLSIDQLGSNTNHCTCMFVYIDEELCPWFIKQTTVVKFPSFNKIGSSTHKHCR